MYEFWFKWNLYHLFCFSAVFLSNNIVFSWQLWFNVDLSTNLSIMHSVLYLLNILEAITRILAKYFAKKYFTRFALNFLYVRISIFLYCINLFWYIVEILDYLCKLISSIYQIFKYCIIWTSERNENSCYK